MNYNNQYDNILKEIEIKKSELLKLENIRMNIKNKMYKEWEKEKNKILEENRKQRIKEEIELNKKLLDNGNFNGIYLLFDKEE